MDGEVSRRCDLEYGNLESIGLLERGGMLLYSTEYVTQHAEKYEHGQRDPSQRRFSAIYQIGEAWQGPLASYLIARHPL